MRSAVYTVEVRVDRRGGDVASLLDMLRYEAARVLSWDRTERGYRVTISSDHYEPERWRSFAITPREVY